MARREEYGSGSGKLGKPGYVDSTDPSQGSELRCGASFQTESRGAACWRVDRFCSVEAEGMESGCCQLNLTGNPNLKSRHGKRSRVGPPKELELCPKTEPGNK
ncbi:hypothetical protein XENORESO_006081 [Xenotaenia resolanae]|uniref:Uncharacterized protein n=1 Tax=Xenotaenia resolanae TaxID=208358 RepID=A0ABV0WDC3_9TELE